MIKKIQVLKVPECGYVVIGKQGTYHKDQIVDISDVSQFDPEEIKNLLQDGYIKEFVEGSSPEEKTLD